MYIQIHSDLIEHLNEFIEILHESEPLVVFLCTIWDKML